MPGRATLELVAKTGQQAISKGVANRAFQHDVGAARPLEHKWESVAERNQRYAELHR